MENNNNSKKNIWIYAVVLFTSAFIVLLLTALSQIKFNRNIDKYKNEINDEKNAKINFQMNLNSALKENEALREENENIKTELAQLKDEYENTVSNLNELQDKYEKTIAAYEKLLEAESEFNAGNFTESAAILLKEINYEYLQGVASNKYVYLKEKTFASAAETLYFSGYKEYKNEAYEKAIEKFELSFNLANDQYYSDDALYFLAYSYYHLGNKDVAKEYWTKLLNDYPESTYKKEAERMLNK